MLLVRESHGLGDLQTAEIYFWRPKSPRPKHRQIPYLVRICFFSVSCFQMGMMNNPNPYGSPYTQNSGQQMGASGLGLQIPTKSVLPNSLSPFAMDKKAVPGGGMPNMVGSNLSADLFSI